MTQYGPHNKPITDEDRELICKRFKEIQAAYRDHGRWPANGCWSVIANEVGIWAERLYPVLQKAGLYRKTLPWGGKHVSPRALARQFGFVEKAVANWRLLSPTEEEVKGLIANSIKDEEDQEERERERRKRERAIVAAGGVWIVNPFGFHLLDKEPPVAMAFDAESEGGSVSWAFCSMYGIKKGTGDYEFALSQRAETEDGNEILKRLREWRHERSVAEARERIVEDFREGRISRLLGDSEARDVLGRHGLQWPKIKDQEVVCLYREVRPDGGGSRLVASNELARLIGAPDAKTVEEILARNGVWLPPTTLLNALDYKAIRDDLLRGRDGRRPIVKGDGGDAEDLSEESHHGDHWIYPKHDIEVVLGLEPCLKYVHGAKKIKRSQEARSLCRKVAREAGLQNLTADFFAKEMPHVLDLIGEDELHRIACSALVGTLGLANRRLEGHAESIDHLRWLAKRLSAGDFGTKDDLARLKGLENAARTGKTDWVAWSRVAAENRNGLMKAALGYVQQAEGWEARAEAEQQRQWLSKLPKRQRTLHQLKQIISDIHLEGCEGFTRAQLVVLLQQAGLDKLSIQDGKDIFIRVTKGCILPRELLNWGVSDELEPPAPSPEEAGAEDADGETDDVEPGVPAIEGTPVDGTEESPEDDIPSEEEPGEDQPPEEVELPDLALMDPTDQLRFLDSEVFACADEEAVDALVAMGQHQLWGKAYLGDEHEQQVVEACKQYDPQRPWSARMQKEFLRLHTAATSAPLPSEYGYRVDGKLVQPRLMQRHAAALAREKRRLLLLADMGTGKSLAAQLAAMSDGAKRILVIPLNVCVEQWANDFRHQWHGIEVANVQGRTDGERCDGKKPLRLPAITSPGKAQAWILPESLVAYLTDRDIHSLLEEFQPDAVIVDEVQRFKLADQKTESKRRKQLVKLLCGVVERNDAAMILALSGTAVVNNLLEAKTLVEMVTCESRPDLGTRISLANMMRLHQALMVNGVRQRAHNAYPFKVTRPRIDATEYLDDVRSIQRTRHREIPYRTEKAIFPARIPAVVRAIHGPTIVAVQYVEGFVEPLRSAIEAAGYSVGVFSGEDRFPVKGHEDAVAAFKAGAIDVLIATIGTIGTGVDGLQLACSNLVIASMPWTAASYLQLIARLARSGQLKVVRVVIPTTYIDHWSNKESRVMRYSFCEWRAAVIECKRRIMDAVQDGLIPDSEELTASAMGRRIGLWLKRLDEDGAIVRLRRPVTVPLTFALQAEELTARRHYGDFSSCNGRWNSVSSDKLHARLQRDPQNWELYHTDLEQLRRNWTVDPLDEAIRFCSTSSGLVIGDFGCGTAQLAEALRGRHTVKSFDHIAINDSVVACDIAAGVPLENESLDYAVFSLSLMGSNWKEQLTEAWRCLRPTGQLLIWTAGQGKDPDAFTADVEAAGFKAIKTEAHYKWLHIWAARINAPVAVAAMQAEEAQQ